MTKTRNPEEMGSRIDECVGRKPTPFTTPAIGPMKWHAGLLALVMVAMGVVVWTPEVAAQEELSPKFEDDISVVQRKPFLRKGRVELTPSFGSTVNDSLIQQFDISGQLTYHISESFWVAGVFSWYDLGELGGVTDEYFEVLERTSSIPDLVEMRWFGGVEVGYVPLFGKFALFNSVIIYYDLSLFVGGGLATHITGATDGEAGAPSAVVGVQQRTFLTDWLALQIQVKDTAFLANMKAGPDSESSELTQIVEVAIGASVFIPFSFDYTTER